MNKSLVYLCVIIVGLIGSYIPVIFGAAALSGWSILGGLIGGIAGIWLATRLNDYF